MTEIDLVRSVEWEPAYDRRKMGPNGRIVSGGAHCVNCRFVLTGPAGVVELVLHTGWWLEKMVDDMVKNPNLAFALKALPADVIAHSHRPWEATDEARPACHRLKGDCYTRSWGPLEADRIFERFVAKGESVIWAALEGRYVEMKGLQPT